MKTSIIVRLTVEGIHHWPTCDIEEVAYLKDPHRHQFNIIGKKEVNHHDRDIEFIQLSHLIKDYLEENYIDGTNRLCNFGAKSCEMLAQELLLRFELDECEVNEDGEGGAIVER